jgi:pimeloyl-ACP methyl ester carboxylesterase
MTIKKIIQRVAVLFLLFFASFSYSEAEALHQQAQKVHPVILVHGINAQASGWRDARDGPTIYHYTMNDGYDMYYVTTFAYLEEQRQNGDHNSPLDDQRTDSFQDVSLIATYLSKEVNYLYEISGGQQVDIVAHSLGGLVTREYFRQNTSNHRIGKFIDIGTPHSGSSYIGLYHSLPQELQLAVLSAMDNLYNQFGFALPDPSSVAGQQLVPDSPFLQRLNSSSSPMDVQYWMLYGDIQVQAKLEVFWWEVYSQVLMAGDLVVSRENAATIPGVGKFDSNSNPSNYHTVGFKSPTNLILAANILPGKIDWDVRAEGPLTGFIPYWHNGLLANPDVNEKILTILNDGYVVPEPPVTPPINLPVTSSTVLLFDVSGSMDEQDATGMTKMQAAQSAGARILDIIQAENIALLGSEVAILSFSSRARVNESMTMDIEQARAAVDRLNASGVTAMADGLRQAMNQFSSTPGSNPMIVLMSDGIPNIGLGGNRSMSPERIREQLLDLASEAGAQGICIYVVGFGVPLTTGDISGDASIDEELLKQVAANSGCGAYYNAQNATDLANVYVNLRHKSLGKVLFSQSGEIAQGQTLDLGMVPVPQGQDEMLLTLNWPGSRIDPSLVDPAGKLVDRNYPGATFYESKSLASIIIQNPMAGNWNVSAVGVDIPTGKTVFNSVVSVRGVDINSLPPPSGAGMPLAVAIILVAVLGLAVYVVVTTNRRARPATASAGEASLAYVSGGAAGTRVFLHDNYIIGRGRACDLQLSERAVSRQHARLRYSNGEWYIQDMGSDGGVFLNGQKVSAARLTPGDRVRIGASEFEFTE